MAQGDIQIDLLLNASQAERELRQFRSKAGGFKASVTAISTGFLAVARAVGIVAGAVGKFIGLLREQEQVEAKLEAVVRATGGAAGFTAAQLKKQAAALQEVTRFGDEAIISFQTVLATFRNIRGDEFERVTKLALDMSEVLGTDLKAAAIQLGKALNDPITGLTSLTRAGITFSKEQKEVIRALQETGDMAGAQGVILDELAEQFKETAEAAADTLTGRLDQLGNALGDVGEAIGRLADSEGSKDFIEDLTTMTSETGRLIDNLNRISEQSGFGEGFSRSFFGSLTGVNLDKINEGLEKLNENLGGTVPGAGAGAKKGKDEFQRQSDERATIEQKAEDERQDRLKEMREENLKEDKAAQRELLQQWKKDQAEREKLVKELQQTEDRFVGGAGPDLTPFLGAEGQDEGFRATFVGLEQLGRGIQSAAASRQKQEEMTEGERRLVEQGEAEARRHEEFLKMDKERNDKLKALDRLDGIGALQ